MATTIEIESPAITVTVGASGPQGATGPPGIGGGGALTDLTDVTITTPASGQVVQHNGTEWVNQANPVTAHEAAADPHAGYQRETEKAAANGYASLDANTRVPYAQMARLPVTTKTAAHTAVAGTDHVIRCDATAGAFSISLPAASGLSGVPFIVKKIDASANAVTIDPNAAETIDGAATLVLSVQYESATLVGNGTGWDLL